MVIYAQRKKRHDLKQQQRQQVLGCEPESHQSSIQKNIFLVTGVENDQTLG